MKRIAVTDMKNRLSEFLRLVKRGETIEILERSVPIARLVSVARSGAEASKLKDLVRSGVVRAPEQKLEADFFARPRVACSGDAVEILIEQRGDR